MDEYILIAVSVSPFAPSKAMLSRGDLFRVFSEPSRLKVLALCAEQELSIGELSTLLKDSQPQLSRKVATLKQVGLLETRKDGTRTWVKKVDTEGDALVDEALVEGRRLCIKEGALARLPKVIAAREERGLEVFDNSAPAEATSPSPPHLAHLFSLSTILPADALAIDIGTGDGLNLDVLAPLYRRVIAVDRSRGQLARALTRISDRGFNNVSVFEGSYDDVALAQRVDALNGADLVFLGRALHHASQPSMALSSVARLLKPRGQLVILDYLPHQDDSMREQQGDVWMGFSTKSIQQHLIEAGLVLKSQSAVPPAFHTSGPDAALDWHVWVAVKPQTQTQGASNESPN